MIEYLIGSPQFVKVTEKLPPENCKVLVFGEYDCTSVEIPKDIPEEERKGIFYDLATLTENGWVFSDCGFIPETDKILRVDYWSPLPKIWE